MPVSMSAQAAVNPKPRPMLRRVIPGNDGQHEMRGMRRFMENGLVRREEIGINPELVTGVWIAVETWEIAAGNLEPDPVPLKKDIRGHPKIYFELFGLAWLKQPGLVAPLAITGPKNAVANVVGLPVRINVD